MEKQRQRRSLRASCFVRRTGTSYVAEWNGKPVNEQEIYPKEESRVVSEEKEPDAPGGEVSAEALEEFLELLEEEPEEVMPPSYVCEKIQRKDLARLPQKRMVSCQ